MSPEKFSMLSQMQKLFLIVFLVLGSAIQAVQAQGLTTEQKKSVETIIYDYLLKNPLVIRQALDSLQVQEENQKKLQQAAAIQKLRAELLSNPASPVKGSPNGDVTIVEFFDYN
ncbi:MAG: DsbA family protein, partial [Alphaproteobacteria bacterium]